MSTATLTRAVTVCPVWCVGCDTPDPGVVVHWSRQWTGGSAVERSADWQVQVSQRITDNVPALAVVEVASCGAYLSTAAFTTAVGEAQSLADDINRGIR